MSTEPTVTVERKIDLAYLDVFGDPAKRTAHQRLVWSDIESFCHAYRLSCEAITGGHVVESNTLVNEGRRSFWLRARAAVLRGTALPKQGPRVSRRPAQKQP